MGRALAWIDEQVEAGRPIYAQVWFHAVHTPLVAGDEDRALYPDQPIDAQHWFGCITAMDRQVGRLRAHLEDLGIADNTIVWFCSDNGPSYIHNYNSAGPYRGKKAELLEGGVRVPAIVSWPARLEGGRAKGQPMVTSDFYPTLIAAAGVALPEGQPELDGIDLMPILSGTQTQRETPIGFVSPQRGGQYDADPDTRQYAWHDGPWKLYSVGGERWELYHLARDPGEANDLSGEYPGRVAGMRSALLAWVQRVDEDAARLNAGE